MIAKWTYSSIVIERAILKDLTPLFLFVITKFVNYFEAHKIFFICWFKNKITLIDLGHDY
jgi:hypothetical protein